MPARRPKPYRVFISHATADKEIARMIGDRIDTIPGTATFRDDRDIGGGESIPGAIRAAIRRCDQLLVLMTPTSITRPWVLLEIGMAYGQRKLIVPICYNAGADAIDLLAMMRAYPLDDLESYLNDLRRRVKRSKR
jgi:hypothetical protein